MFTLKTCMTLALKHCIAITKCDLLVFLSRALEKAHWLTEFSISKFLNFFEMASGPLAA